MEAHPGAAIRRLREERGDSQATTAVAVGCSQPFLSCVEKGLRTPSIAMLNRIAAAFEVTAAELLAPVPDDEATV